MGIMSKVMWCFTIFFGWSENTSGKAVTPEQRPKEGKETNSVCISGKNTLGRGTDNVQALQQSGACVLENHPGHQCSCRGEICERRDQGGMEARPCTHWILMGM